MIDTTKRISKVTYNGKNMPLVGGTEPIVQKEVSFLDYDGSLVASYSIEEAKVLRSLPDNPDHTDIGLISQGWNWTLEDIHALDHRQIIGQMYDTADHNTHVFIELTDKNLLTVYGSFANATVDWGDGSTPDSSTSIHTYQNVGTYEIVIDGSKFNFKFNSSNYGAKPMLGLFINPQTHANSNIVKRVNVGSSITNLSNGFKDAFTHLTSMTVLTVPNIELNVESLFSYATSLTMVTLPINTVIKYTPLGMYAYGLRHISLPRSSNGVTDCYGIVSQDGIEEFSMPEGIISSGSSDFAECYNLKYVYLPTSYKTAQNSCFSKAISLIEVDAKGLTALAGSMFTGCKSLQKVCAPNVTEIGNGAFQNCEALETYTIGELVSTIGSNAFYGCKSLGLIEVKAVTPPTIQSNTFPSLRLEKIIVPKGCLEAYQSATNWSSYASKMVEADE